jgi:hypothetical protein
MSTAILNAFYAQSGGVTSVINASACGVIETARRHPDRIGKLYAGRNGIIGALTEELIDTGAESAEAIAALRSTPSGAFGSCRYKLKSLEKNRREYERLIEVFKAHGIGYFFYNGGGDSADTCFKVSQLSQSLGYPLQAIHVPKTIDNDLPLTDCCPGFGSVAKYVAVSTLEASFDVRSMAATSTKVFVLEVMGRHAGWIAAAGGLAADHGIPVVVLFPEIEFDKAALHRARRRTGEAARLLLGGGVRGLPPPRRHLPGRAGHARCFRPCAARRRGAGGGADGQGRAGPQVPLGGGRLPAARGPPHRLGHRREAGLRAGAARGRAGARRPQRGDADHRAHVRRAVRLPPGQRAARIGGECREADAARFHLDDGYGITEKCRRYLLPLIEGEDYPAYRNGCRCT